MIAATVHGSATSADDLERNVYCVLGLPIDALDMRIILDRICTAATGGRTPCLISTPNLNFLVNSRSDPAFRESILDSDLCPADGMPIVWIARLIGAPIKKRVSGSDIFDSLKTGAGCGRVLRVFLFGGAEGAAATARNAINATSMSLKCVGAFNPGVGSVEDMSRNDILDRLNASQADFLVVALGSKKGQLWLHQNHHRLTIPLRAHLGAAMNFAAGRVKRAPRWLRACGLEWLWRIKEEPDLWRRYTHDGSVLLRIVLTRALPLALLNRWYRLKSRWGSSQLLISIVQNDHCATIRLAGDATECNISTAINFFRETLMSRNTNVVIDLGSTRIIDGRFLGLLLMLRKNLKSRGANLSFVRVSPAIRKLFCFNDLNFLVESAVE